MAKRLTDAGKWDDPWFLDLPNEFKLLWLFLLDKCDHAGIWKVNTRLAEFCLNSKYDWDSFLKICAGRIVPFDKDKWFIPKFIFFQYGVLSEDCRPHRPVIGILKKFDLEGYCKGINTLCNRVKDKDKEQEKEKDQDKDQDKDAFKGGSRGEKKKEFGEEGLVMLTVAEFEKLVARLGEKRTHEYIQRLENYIGSKGKRYKSHYHTILNWLGNDDGAEKLKSKVRGKQDIVDSAQRILEEIRK